MTTVMLAPAITHASPRARGRMLIAYKLLSLNRRARFAFRPPLLARGDPVGFAQVENADFSAVSSRPIGWRNVTSYRPRRSRLMLVAVNVLGRRIRARDAVFFALLACSGPT